MLIVSGETYDRTAAESARPMNENRLTAVSSRGIAKSAVGRVGAKVLDIGPPYNETHRLDCSSIPYSVASHLGVISVRIYGIFICG